MSRRSSGSRRPHRRSSLAGSSLTGRIARRRPAEPRVLTGSEGALHVAGEVADALVNLALLAEALRVTPERPADPRDDVSDKGAHQEWRDPDHVPSLGRACPEGRALTIVEGVPAVKALP